MNKSVSQYNKAVKAPEKQWDDDLVRVEADCGSSRSRLWFESKQNVVRDEAERGSSRSTRRESRYGDTTPPPGPGQSWPEALRQRCDGRAKKNEGVKKTTARG